ncbi:hypothetical protein AB0J74_32155 [Asanoa sp. NPDC049573]|uniref:hypothetical protein n=1 Tax=Asanoa sp. NPDC049573 TaxID=3155396 RepID=UPI0034382A77
MTWTLPITLVAVLAAGCGDGGAGGSASDASAGQVGSGVAGQSPEQIIERAKAALETAKSYRVDGSLSADSFAMGFHVNVSGSDLAGRIAIPGQGSLDLLEVAGQQYIRPDEELWAVTRGAAAAKNIEKAIGTGWARLSAGKNEFSELFGGFDVDQMLVAEGALSMGEPRTIADVECVSVVDGGQGGAALFVAKTGEPYPMLLQGAPGNATLVQFSDFGKTFDIKAPADADVVDYDKLLNR